MITWMLYAALVGTLIAAGAFAVERLVASQGKPRRFVWLAALGLAVVVPLVGGLREPLSTEVIRAAGPAEPAAPGTARVEGIARFGSPLPGPSSRVTARTAGIAWVAGSTAALAVLCSVLVAVAWARRRWPRVRVDGMEVYLSRRFGPALVGIVAPKPVIPAWVQRAEPSSRAAILLHELEHARARDHLALLYAAIVAVVFPWSPPIWWMCRRLRAAIEIDCDQRVIAGGIATADYGKVLLQAWTRAHGRWGLVPAMGQPRSLLERRLKTMMEERLRLSAAHGALLAAAALVTLGIACEVPAPTRLDEAMDQVMADGQESPNSEATARLADPYQRIADAFHRGHPAGTPPPIVFVDGQRLSGPTGAPGPTDSGFRTAGLPTGPVSIMRVEVLKHSAAQRLLGEEVPGGVVRIFTADSGPVTTTLTDWSDPTGSPNTAQPAGLGIEHVLAEVEEKGANPGVLTWFYSVTGYGSFERELDILSGRR